MQPMSHQMMGYDRAITMFSPDGRLLQVEYAKKTVRQGSTAIGIACQDGAVLITDKRIVDKLIVVDSVEKIFQIDTHIGASAAGIISDARLLVERAQLRAQQHRVTYDTPVDALTIVKDICALKQMTTQSGGFRPFGVSLLIISVDRDGPKLFETDPTGLYFQYKATAIGEGEVEVEEMLHKEYKDDMKVEDGIQLGIRSMMRALNKKFSAEQLDVAYITTKDKSLVRMGRDDLSKVIAKVKKSAPAMAGAGAGGSV